MNIQLLGFVIFCCNVSVILFYCRSLNKKNIYLYNKCIIEAIQAFIFLNSFVTKMCIFVNTSIEDGEHTILKLN